MGIYYTTKLSVGKFDKVNPRIDREVIFAQIDKIIEKCEWEQGYVLMGDILRVIKKDETLEKNVIIMLESKSINDDIFFTETEYTTLGGKISPISVKSLIIK